MLQVKALTKIFEDWGEDETNFFASYQVDIGLSEVEFGSDMFAFDVVSPKRLNGIITSQGSKFGHGYIILDDFQESTIRKMLDKLLEECKNLTEQEAYQNLAKYLRWEMETFQPKL